MPSSAGSLQYLLLFSYLCVRKITFIWGIPQKFVFVFYIKKISFICGTTQIFVVVFLFLKEITFIRRPTQIFDFLLVGSLKYLLFYSYYRKSPWYVGSMTYLLLYSYSRKITLKYLLLYSYLRKITFICGITPDRTTLFASGWNKRRNYFVSLVVLVLAMQNYFGNISVIFLVHLGKLYHSTCCFLVLVTSLTMQNYLRK